MPDDLKNATLVRIEHIPGAGRGVKSSQTIVKDALVLKNDQPAAHVVFWEYRKETCAQCFHYNRGRKLPFKHVHTGKAFCSNTCQSAWLKAEGSLGLAAWAALFLFIQSKSKSITNSHGRPSPGNKPGRAKIESEWISADETLRAYRYRNDSTRQKHQNPIALPSSQTEVVDPDILSFLLSGALYHKYSPSDWTERIDNLELDLKPYRSEEDLNAHCNSFIQLAAIVPDELRSSVNIQVCQRLIEAANHNSFGIHGGSSDGEEYMGYALYPEASYFNHSCRPNIVKERVGRMWSFRAVREIDEGEECCITYLGGDEERLIMIERRQRLMLNWGFLCMCEGCEEVNAEGGQQAVVR